MIVKIWNYLKIFIFWGLDGWLVYWLNNVMLLSLTTLKKFKNSQWNPTPAEFAQKDPPSFPEYFLDKRFCFAKYAIISSKIDKIHITLWNSKFFLWMVFFKCILFLFYLFIYLFIGKICYYFFKNRWNLWQIIEIWTFFMGNIS